MVKRVRAEKNSGKVRVGPIVIPFANLQIGHVFQQYIEAESNGGYSRDYTVETAPAACSPEGNLFVMATYEEDDCAPTT